MPIIMLTARASPTDRIVGLELGADDYVVKPFAVAETCWRAWCARFLSLRARLIASLSYVLVLAIVSLGVPLALSPKDSGEQVYPRL